jgi:hypothetical protein
MRYLGWYMESGIGDGRKDEIGAVPWYVKAVNLKDADAMALLGRT